MLLSTHACNSIYFHVNIRHSSHVIILLEMAMAKQNHQTHRVIVIHIAESMMMSPLRALIATSHVHIPINQSYFEIMM